VPSLQVRIIYNIVYQQNDTHNLVGLTQSERVGYRELFSQVVTQPVNPIYSGAKNCPNVCTIFSIHFIAPLNVKIRIKCGSTPESPASWLSFNIWVKGIGHYISKI
jgi:hypothetical protein